MERERIENKEDKNIKIKKEEEEKEEEETKSFIRGLIYYTPYYYIIYTN